MRDGEAQRFFIPAKATLIEGFRAFRDQQEARHRVTIPERDRLVGLAKSTAALSGFVGRDREPSRRKRTSPRGPPRVGVLALGRPGSPQRLQSPRASQSSLSTISGTPMLAGFAMHSHKPIGTMSGTSGFTRIRLVCLRVAKISWFAG